MQDVVTGNDKNRTQMVISRETLDQWFQCNSFYSVFVSGDAQHDDTRKI